MVVTFTPRVQQTYTHSLQLLCNEPGHMDLSVAELTVTGQGRAGQMTMTVEGQSNDRKVLKGEWEVWQLRLTNSESEDVDLEYEVAAEVVSGSEDSTRVQLWPGQGRLSGGSSRLVSVNMQSDECGQVVVRVKLAVHPSGLTSTLQLTANVVEQLITAETAAEKETQLQEEESRSSIEQSDLIDAVVETVSV